MGTSVRRALRRLAHPRSRRSQLWAFVYCGAFDGDTFPDSDDAEPAQTAD